MAIIQALPNSASRKLTLARRAVAFTFFANGMMFANWVARIPAVQTRLDLSEGALGVALLGIAVGALVTMPLVGGLIARLGSRIVTLVAALCFCALLPLPAAAFNLTSLLLALVFLGATMGALDIAMNAHGAAVERQMGRPIMSSFHAFMSFGGMAGAGIGGLLAGVGVGPLTHLLCVALIVGVSFCAISRWFLPGESGVQAGGQIFARPTPALFGLGAIAFCVLMSEGAMADWGALYLRNALQAEAGLAALGYAVFSLTMGLGRLAGDRLNARFGSVMLVRWGGLLTAAGWGIALFLSHPVAAFVGFACAGLGLSFIFPVVLSVAGQNVDLPPSTSIAAVSTVGYTGFLAGPPLIGFVAEWLGLPLALSLIAIGGGIVALLAGCARERTQPRITRGRKRIGRA